MKSDRAYLPHIHEAIEDIEHFLADATKETFLLNKEKQYAVRSALEIIGEATKYLSEDIRKKKPQVPWKKIAGMRDKLIHVYFGINWELVWETATTEMPSMKEIIAELIAESPSNHNI